VLVETDFPINSAEMGGGGSRECILTKKRCHTKNYKKYKVSNDNLRKRDTVMNSHLYCPTVQVVTQVPEDYLKKSSTEVWHDKDLFFSFRISS